MKKPAARKRKQAAVKPRVAAPAPPAALATVIDLAKEDDIDLTKPFSEKAIDRLKKLAPEPAVAMLASTINKVSRRLAFELSRIRRAIADLAVRQPTGPAVPFRQGMQTMLGKLPEASETAEQVVKADPSRNYLQVLLEEMARHKDLADTEFRRQRREGKAGGDPRATMRTARGREKKLKA